MTQIQTPLIWKKLIVEGVKVVSSDHIKEIAKRIGKGDTRSLRYLQEHGYIYRILRGTFYVKSPEEIERNYFKYSIYEMVSEALKLKGVEYWYFGLETASKMNRMTHEYFTVDYVITDSFRTTKTIEILGSKYLFLKWSMKNAQADGRVKRITDHGSSIFYSNKEKTVLDISYKKYLEDKDERSAIAPLIEFRDQLDQAKLMLYLPFYPPKYREMVEGGGVLHSSERAV